MGASLAMNSNQKGAIAEHAISLEAVRLGICVLRPMTEQMPYDLMFDLGSKLLRVQCKWARLKGDVIEVRLRRSYHSPTRGYVLSNYALNEIDAVAAYCDETGRCYLLPSPLIADRGWIQLRLSPARNNQTASINWASDFELGAVAQLEERVSGTHEAEGSSPSSSTLKNSVGMDEFDAKIAHYVRHAEAGNEILVTRWGRPVAKLGPPQPPLPAT
jgi:prevent-host-death family protein